MHHGSRSSAPVRASTPVRGRHAGLPIWEATPANMGRPPDVSPGQCRDPPSQGGTLMALFMDSHAIDGGVKASDVAQAHLADLRTQDRYGVRYLRYWVDERAGRIFCLIRAPTRQPSSRMRASSRPSAPRSRSGRRPADYRATGSATRGSIARAASSMSPRRCNKSSRSPLTRTRRGSADLLTAPRRTRERRASGRRRSRWMTVRSHASRRDYDLGDGAGPDAAVAGEPSGRDARA
jgi:hypothetical protein